MKKLSTPSSFSTYTLLKVIIVLHLLAFHVVFINATTIVPNAATAIKLTTATLGATISPSPDVVEERGIVWSTSPGVQITDHKTVDAGGLTGGSFSLNITGLTRSQTIYYCGYFKIGGVPTLSAELSFSNIPVFTGSGDWDNASRWSVGELPGVTAGDSPVIDGICTLANNSSNGSWVCDDLTINAGRKLTINPGQVLHVNGILTNNDAEAGLVIKSDGIIVNGTLTFNNDPSHPLLATVEMYSKASWDLNQAGGSKYSWQFFGIPVKTISLSNGTFTNCLIRKYNETSVDELGLWTAQSTVMSLTMGIGYEIVQQNPHVYVFAGELNNNDFTQPLNYVPGAKFPGQHIFSNPYTAAIDITKIAFDANTEHSIYLYNTGTYNDWYDNSGSVSDGTTTAPGQYVVSTPATAGVLSVPAEIPSMQGFLIKNLLTTSGTITIPYIGSTMNNTEFQRAPGLYKVENMVKTATRIHLSGTHSADNMWIFTDPTCTGSFDNGWDGYKIQGAVQTPQLYAMEAAGDLQIDAIADINGTYLGFNAGTDTDYKLTFTHQHTDARYSGLYLVDLVENKTVDITANGSEYAFTSISTPTPVKRFKIITGTEVATNTPLTGSLIKIINSNGTLVVQNQTNQNGEVTIYTMNGIAVEKMTYSANGITTFSTSQLQPGAYVARAYTDKEMVTERIIIR
jgi:hypothetical protein